jgi:hypothetical protein
MSVSPVESPVESPPAPMQTSPTPELAPTNKKTPKICAGRLQVSVGATQPGARIACQLFRTIFDTWLNTQEPTAIDRLYIAKLMCHECSTQMITYTKNSKAGHKRRHSSGEPKSKRARPVSQSESDDEDVVVPERRSSTRRAMAASLA